MPKPTTVLYVRLDPAIYDRLQKIADENYRSVNKQVEYILAKFFETQSGEKDK